MDYLLNAYDYFRPGGAIMVVLVMMSCWMWGLIFNRLFCFRAMARQDVIPDQAPLLLGGEHNPPPATGICRGMISRFTAARTGVSALDHHILDQYAMHQRPGLHRHLPIITILAATAPLMGLLGTVTGMVATFDVITLFGTGNAKALSAGISKALVTTQSGLLVGIPGLLMSRLLTRRAQAIERRITETVIIIKRAI
jgi:biopolymer transport protein ExbB